ncbi:MAG: hypothetical protein NVS9B9_17380 [Ktedonobacteraceae bacterium]
MQKKTTNGIREKRVFETVPGCLDEPLPMPYRILCNGGLQKTAKLGLNWLS